MEQATSVTCLELVFDLEDRNTSFSIVCEQGYNDSRTELTIKQNMLSLTFAKKVIQPVQTSVHDNSQEREHNLFTDQNGWETSSTRGGARSSGKDQHTQGVH